MWRLNLTSSLVATALAFVAMGLGFGFSGQAFAAGIANAILWWFVEEYRWFEHKITAGSLDRDVPLLFIATMTCGAWTTALLTNSVVDTPIGVAFGVVLLAISILGFAITVLAIKVGHAGSWLRALFSAIPGIGVLDVFHPRPVAARSPFSPNTDT